MTSPVGPHVTVIGPVNIDLFMRGEAPLQREILNEWVGPSDVQLIVAGSVGYTAQDFARLGAQVELCSTVGDDAFGAYIRAELEAAGVGLHHVSLAHGPTAIAIYLLLFGGAKRPMTYRLPAFGAWPEPLPSLAFERLDLVHCGGLLHFPELWGRSLAPTFAAARRAGVATSLDPQFPLVDTPAPWLPHIADVLAETDVLLCDDGESRHLFDVDDLGERLRRAHAAGPRVVVIKDGARGSVVSDGRGVVHQPAVPIPTEQVREAVGAGDAFDAGFLDALTRGAATDQAARFATATAALSLLGRGGTEGIAGRAAVEAALDRVPPAECRAHWP